MSKIIGATAANHRQELVYKYNQGIEDYFFLLEGYHFYKSLGEFKNAGIMNDRIKFVSKKNKELDAQIHFQA